MYREPDRFHCVGAAVPGGVHYTGGSRCVFAAAAVAALHAAHPVRHGSGHHAGGQCVEPAAACYPARTDFAASGMDPIGSGACAWRSGPFAGGTVCRAAAGRRGRTRRTHGAGYLPEGMVAGLAAALALTGEPDAISGALALSLGIGLQNIPEGAAVSLPLAHNGRTRSQAFFAGAASGLVEPLGALLAFALAEWVSAALPWLLSAAAGCMVCVTAQEMIPQAVEGDEPAGVVSIVLGFALMMALDVAL